MVRLMLLVVLSLAVVISHAEVRAPNKCDLYGPRGLELHFTATSIGGQPTLSYHDNDRDLSFTGDEIKLDKTAIGLLVTVTIESLRPVDGPDKTFSFLLPTIDLGTRASVDFQSRGLYTKIESGFGGPPNGVYENYRRSMVLQGIATQVQF
jgi:hypothetical protein